MKLDRIILSSDENPMYIEFWGLVSTAWKKFFPEIKVSLAFVSNKTSDDPFVGMLSQYGDVHIINPIIGIPIANQAKIARHILASTFDSEIVCLHDIDTCPLNRKYTENFINQRKENTILRVGKEVFDNSEHAGKFPMSHVTAEGRLWKEIINPLSLNINDLITSWVGMKVFDHKEDISSPPNIFSDESLIRALLSRNNEFLFSDVVRRVNIYSEWIDRSWWNVDISRLYDGGYVEANFLRPFSSHWNYIKPIADFILEKDSDESIIINLKSKE